MYQIAKYFLEFAKELVGLGSTLKQAALDRRIRLSQYLENIAGCLSALANAFRTKGHASSLCGELDEYVDGLNEVCKGIIPDETIERFRNLLDNRAHARGVTMVKFADEELRMTEADEMDNAAGQLRAFANSLRV